MAVVQINLKVSPAARDILAEVARRMTDKSGRQVTYSEAIERLAALYMAGVSQP